MANAIFFHKIDSGYDDQPDKYYHFPKIYLKRVEQTLGDRIIYYGPLPRKNGRYYTSVAKVSRIRADKLREKHYYADVEEYIEFDQPINYRAKGGYERKLVLADGSINGGIAQNAVRLIDPAEFARIVEDGFVEKQEWPDREAQPIALHYLESGFSENFQTQMERPIIECLSQKKFRDKKFRQHILDIYDRTCAFTGLRLINGGGRPEVAAAHIVPVEQNGTDSVRNGIALSGTVHWMFDRGLLSLSDNFDILISRQLNHDVSHLLNKNLKAKVPDSLDLRPHPKCLEWHRENCFKQ